MKIVLFALNGSWSHSCLAIRCLRPPLERDGFDVVLIENTIKDRSSHILERLYAEQADIYGFSCYIWNLDQMLALAENLHALLPRCRIVLGGPEVSYDTRRFEKMDCIDAIVSGEGEEAFLTVCRNVRDGVPIPRLIDGGTPRVMKDEGILYREGEQTGGILYYESSRGCPYSCAYCLSSATHGVRLKPVEQTLTDMKAFESFSGNCKIIKFVDRTFNANVKRANEIWRALLDEHFTKHYHFEVCASLLNEESFEILSQFPKGKIQLEFGLQSTYAPTLAECARHINPHAVIAAVKRIYEMGNIHVHLDLIAGLPYESYERFAQSFDEAYGCCDLLQLGFLKLLHGTRLREKQDEYGYVALSNPPYTVLQSKWISYPQMQRLTHIAEVLDRYLESGRFVHALWFLTPQMPSPFRFWEGLTLYLQSVDARPLQKISQPDAFRYFWQYAKQTISNLDTVRLANMLCADFTQHEHKNPPAFFKNAATDQSKL